MTENHPIDRLFDVIRSRKGADPETSYTAKLFAQGTLKIAKKLGEEGVETALAGVAETDDALVNESADLLYHLSTLRAVVRDVPMPARYGGEVSNLRIGAIVGPFALKHVRNFLQRVLGQYFVRDFNAASLEMVFGIFLMLFGIGYGAHYMSVRHTTAASAGVVMAAALPIMLGAQLLMQALNFDVLNVPSRPIHPYLRTIARMDAEERAT